jgi:VWFA-related protein
MPPGPLLGCGALALLAASAAAAPQQPRFEEKVEVSRVVVDARVLDSRGRPILGLGPEDLRLTVDGKPVPLESARWVPAAPGADEGGAGPEAQGARTSAADDPGRLIVLLFQRDIGDRRVKGLIRMKQRARAFLDTLGESDRVAVLLFDSHLRVFCDFTSEKARVAHLLERWLLHEWPPPPEPGPPPSLVAHLDRRAARRAAEPETALLVVADALKPLPGAKSVLFFGWGLGRLSGAAVVMGADYEPARRALAEARAAVFALDVSDADYHTLEVGLKRVADDTGGLYVKTHDFPQRAMTVVEGALLGHYVLSFESPARRRGTHSLAIHLVGRKATVLARSSYAD